MAICEESRYHSNRDVAYGNGLSTLGWERMFQLVVFGAATTSFRELLLSMVTSKTNAYNNMDSMTFQVNDFSINILWSQLQVRHLWR